MRGPRFACKLQVLAVVALCLGAGRPLAAQETAFQRDLAEAAAGAPAVAEFYRARGFDPIWTGRDDRSRRDAFVAALDRAHAHALPEATFAAAPVERAFRTARSEAAKARLEARLSSLFLDYAHAVQSGILDPRATAPGIERRAPRRDGPALLDAFARSSPGAFLRALPPQTPEYARLKDTKHRLERVIGAGGWGREVPGGTLRPGATGERVALLRRRLAAQGYAENTGGPRYGREMQAAVRRFQGDHGLATDGVAGPRTLRALNASPARRLAQVVTAMERERWLNRARGERHVIVNITDYSVRLVEDGRVALRTRAVVGAPPADRQTPEFSGVMGYMMVNPHWYVPRSIAVKEYLPMLKRDPDAVSRMLLKDRQGRTVDRASVDFAQYSRSDFPYRLVEPPSTRNALGRVKFMFPNRYNIYLHDTPAQTLFQHSARAFSHGCIRVHDPYRFAYAVLAPQTRDPEGLFQSRLRTGEARRIDIAEPLPVHIIYRTAFTRPGGRMQYREDVYGRDARIFAALQDAGVVLRAVRG